MNRDDLKKYRYCKKWVDNQINEYIERRTLVERITSTIDDMPKAKNKPNYKLEELMDMFNKILESVTEEQRQLTELMKCLQKVEEPYRTILTDKYEHDMDLTEIAKEIGYSYNRTCSMHGIALNLFDEECRKILYKENLGKKC